MADGKEVSIELKAMFKHWSQQMSAAINGETSRNEQYIVCSLVVVGRM